MNESTPNRRHQRHCAHPDPAHDGGCPLFWDEPPMRSDGSSDVPALREDPWAVPAPAEVEPAKRVGILDYHGYPVPVLVDERGHWVSVTALSRAMIIDGNGQRQLLERKHWSEGWTCMTHAQLPGDTQARPHFFLHEKRVPMWLANIDTSRLGDPFARRQVERTQVEFADVLAEYAATGQVRAKVEASSPSVIDLVHRSDLSNAEWFSLLGQALDRAKGEAAARVEAEERLYLEAAAREEAQAEVRAHEGGAEQTLSAFCKTYFTDVPQSEFFEHLYVARYLIDQRGKGTQREDGTWRDGPQHAHPTYIGKKYIQLVKVVDRHGRTRQHSRVRPDRALALKAALAEDGLRPNNWDGIQPPE